ncbi:hypothetical protein CJ307_34000, partial [Klebsiella quasipneumoniae]
APPWFYTQRCKEAWKDVPVILGGIEASLRRTAHMDSMIQRYTADRKLRHD